MRCRLLFLCLLLAGLAMPPAWSVAACGLAAPAESCGVCCEAVEMSCCATATPRQEVPAALEQTSSLLLKYTVAPVAVVLAPMPVPFAERWAQQRRNALQIPLPLPLERSGVRLI